MIKLKYFLFAICLFPLLIQAQIKQDTLFIKYDYRLLLRNLDSSTKNYYYSIKNKNKGSEFMYFLEKKIHKKIETKSKIFCLKQMLKKSKAYYKKGHFSNWKLFDYLTKIYKDKIFIVKKDVWIEVELIHEVNE